MTEAEEYADAVLAEGRAQHAAVTGDEHGMLAYTHERDRHYVTWATLRAERQGDPVNAKFWQDFALSMVPKGAIHASKGLLIFGEEAESVGDQKFARFVRMYDVAQQSGLIRVCISGLLLAVIHPTLITQATADVFYRMHLPNELAVQRVVPQRGSDDAPWVVFKSDRVDDLRRVAAMM